jgi:type III secretion system FlhB-like substrate exporter
MTHPKIAVDFDQQQQNLPAILSSGKQKVEACSN